MPWMKDTNGNPLYIPSMYVKEELPTWSEVYEEFYKKKMFQYIPIAESDDLDTYWKIPRKRYIMAIVCNQFNHMLYDDYPARLMPKLTKYIQDIMVMQGVKLTVDGVKFICEPGDHDEDFYMIMGIGIKGAPTIYSIPHPKGKENPFIPKDSTRLNWNEYYPDKRLFFTAVIQAHDTESEDPIVFMINHYSDPKIFDMILEYMMIPYKEYFEGEGTGWKDDDGHVITSLDPISHPGSDPAL